MDRRQLQDDRHQEIKDQTFHLFPQRWAQLYEHDLRVALGLESAEGQDKPVTSVDALDKWYESVVKNGEKRVINGSKIPPGMGEYWSDWQ